MAAGSLSAGVAEANHRPPRAPSARTPTAARLCELSGWEVGAGRLRAFGVGPGTRPTTGRVEPPRYLVVLVFGGCTRHEPPELHRSHRAARRHGLQQDASPVFWVCECCCAACVRVQGAN